MIISQNIAEKYTRSETEGSTVASEYYTFQPLQKIHLFSQAQNDMSDNNGRINQVYTLGTIGLLILLIGCINYVNLATSRASKRILEVGVRKVIRAKRRQLIHQFMGETFVYTLMAEVLSRIGPQDGPDRSR